MKAAQEIIVAALDPALRHGLAENRASIIAQRLEAAGYVIVPKEPTQEMLMRGCKAALETGVLLDDTRFACERAVWSTMLANLPA